MTTTKKKKRCTMTIGELIDELRKHPLDYEVFTEGCDCCGEAMSVQVDEKCKSNSKVIMTAGLIKYKGVQP